MTGLDFVETTRLQHAACARQPRACGVDVSTGSESLGGAGAECGVVGGDAVAATAAAAGAGVMDARQRQQQSRGGKADSMSSQYSLLTTTNDSRLRIYDLDHFSMVRSRSFCRCALNECCCRCRKKQSLCSSMKVCVSK